MKSSQSVVHVVAIIDGSTEELVDVIEIPTFELKSFSVQFDVDPKVDPDMHDRYSVGPDDMVFLEKVLGRKLSFDFSQFAYFVEAVRR